MSSRTDLRCMLQDLQEKYIKAGAIESYPCGGVAVTSGNRHCSCMELHRYDCCKISQGSTGTSCNAWKR